MQMPKKKLGKGVDMQYAKNFANALREIIEKDFGGRQRGAAEKALDMTQTHISSLINLRRGPGLDAVISVRNYAQRSVDELLGLPPLRRPPSPPVAEPPPPPADAQKTALADEIRRVLVEEIRALRAPASESEPPPPPSPRTRRRHRPS